MYECRINRERLLQSFLHMLSINAPSRREGKMADYVMARLRELGAEVVVDESAAVLEGEVGNILARVPGTVAMPALLFCAHIDTVEQTENIKIIQHNGIIKSDGSTILGADDKAGVAAILEMTAALLESDAPRPPLELLFTVAEEVGVMGSMVFDHHLLSACHGFVPDSTGQVGLLVTRAPAQQHLEVTIQGKAAHAGMAPEMGISGITVAARAIAAMRQGRIDEETTANIGTIHGGKATNIVPEVVTLAAEARSRDRRKLEEQVQHMRACFEQAASEAGATVEIDVSDVYPAFNLPADSPAVLLARAALEELGILPIVTATGGGSDANYLNAHGVPSVILSAGYHHAHAHDEEIAESQLLLLAQLLCRIVTLAGAK